MSMSKSVWIAGLFLVVVAWDAKGQAWREKYAEAQNQLSDGKYSEAEAAAKASLNGYLAEGAPSFETHAAILRLVAQVCYGKQDYEQALAYADKEITIREVKKDTTYAVALENKAMFQQLLGKYDDAVETLSAARSIFLTAFPEDNINVIECGVGMGTSCYLMNQYAKARSFLAPALATAERKVNSPK